MASNAVFSSLQIWSKIPDKILKFSAVIALDTTCGIDFSAGIWSSGRYHSLSFLANSISAFLALDLYYMLADHNTSWCATTLCAAVNTLHQFCFMLLGWMITRWIKSSFPLPLPLLHYQSPSLSYSLLPHVFFISCLLLSCYSSSSIFQLSPTGKVRKKHISVPENVCRKHVPFQIRGSLEKNHRGNRKWGFFVVFFN